ncbi:MAG: hypothetical protein J7642_21410 [Cyanobacteria bacterium SBC]|nr:hypothetical protein [Cyanobacteria bacterium SBC]
MSKPSPFRIRFGLAVSAVLTIVLALLALEFESDGTITRVKFDPDEIPAPIVLAVLAGVFYSFGLDTDKAALLQRLSGSKEPTSKD